MEFRRVFDTIPEQFDKYRPRYCARLFAELIECARIGPGTRVLELGPGTGQATEPILNTGCDYHAIELGEHLYGMMRRKYGRLPNFHITNDDFITHDFGDQRFDVIYSAATIQWIPEEIAFSKTFALLRPGGTLAMMLTRADYRTPNEALYDRIQRVYDENFRPETPYTHGSFRYDAAPDYGYEALERREYPGTRVMTADEYVAFCGTHCDHLVIPEPYRSRLFEGLRAAVLGAGDRIVFRDTHVLYLAGRPPQGPTARNQGSARREGAPDRAMENRGQRPAHIASREKADRRPGSECRGTEKAPVAPDHAPAGGVTVKRVERGSALAEELLEFVESCSWVEAKQHIAGMIRSWVFTDWEAMFAAVKGGRIVGMASVMKTDYYPLPEIFPWVSCVFVPEAHRGQRISGELIACANRYLKGLGFARSYIPSEFTGLYERYGYRCLRDIVNYGGGRDHLFVKELE